MWTDWSKSLDIHTCYQALSHSHIYEYLAEKTCSLLLALLLIVVDSHSRTSNNWGWNSYTRNALHSLCIIISFPISKKIECIDEQQQLPKIFGWILLSAKFERWEGRNKRRVYLMTRRHAVTCGWSMNSDVARTADTVVIFLSNLSHRSRCCKVWRS